MKKFVLVVWVVCVMSAGCQRRAPDASAHSKSVEAHHDEKEHEELPRQLRLSAEAIATAEIQTTTTKRGALSVTVRLPGEIVAEPDRTARVSSASAGRLEQVMFNEGVLVKKGDPLAILRVPAVGRLRGAYFAASAKAKAAASNAQKLRALKESGLGSEQAVIDAEAESHAQEAESQAFGEELTAMGVNAQSNAGYLVTIRAPLSGVVVSRDAVVGQPINAEHVLATVVDLSQVWFLGRVFEKDLGRLKSGAKAEVQLNAFANTHFDGVVQYIGQQTDPVARTLTARILLKNKNSQLRVGLFGSADVEVLDVNNTNAAHIIIPRSALTDVAGKSVVFVKAKDGDFVVHDVSLGESALANVEILSGLSEGEEVVTHGVFSLKSLMLKSTLSEEEH